MAKVAMKEIITHLSKNKNTPPLLKFVAKEMLFQADMSPAMNKAISEEIIIGETK